MNDRPPVRGEQDEVSFHRAGFGLDCFHLRCLNELRSRSLQAFAGDRQSDQPLRPEGPGGLGQRVHFLARIFCTTGRDDAFDHAFVFNRGLEDAKLALRKDAADVGQFHPETQVGLIGPISFDDFAIGELGPWG